MAKYIFIIFTIFINLSATAYGDDRLLEEHPRLPEVGLPHFFEDKNSFKKPDFEALKNLTFLTSPDYPPFNYVTDQGYVMGYNIDLMRAICEELHLQAVCKIKVVDFDQLITSLLKGEGEVILAGLVRSKANQDLLDFSTPYLTFPARFITLKKNHFTQPSKKLLRYKNIGVIQGSRHQEIAAHYFPYLNLISAKNHEDLHNMLKNERIFAIFDDGISHVNWLNNEGANCCSFAAGPYLFEQNGLRAAYDKKSSYIGPILQYAFSSLEEKGRLQELYMKYFPIGFF